MRENLNNLLWGSLARVAEETGRALGKQEAQCFIHLYLDWVDLGRAITETAKKQELQTSLLAGELNNLGRELLWLHRLLHWGNYALAWRGLRNAWERTTLAFFADVGGIDVHGIHDRPAPTMDAKAAWLEQHASKLHWKSVIRPVCANVLETGDLARFGRFWSDLSDGVDPVVDPRERMFNPALAIKDTFDKRTAVRTVDIAINVFDVIWLLALRKFSGSVARLKNGNAFVNTPRTKLIVRG